MPFTSRISFVLLHQCINPMLSLGKIIPSISFRLVRHFSSSPSPTTWVRVKDGVQWSRGEMQRLKGSAGTLFRNVLEIRKLRKKETLTRNEKKFISLTKLNASRGTFFVVLSQLPFLFWPTLYLTYKYPVLLPPIFLSSQQKLDLLKVHLQGSSKAKELLAGQLKLLKKSGTSLSDFLSEPQVIRLLHSIWLPPPPSFLIEFLTINSLKKKLKKVIDAIEADDRELLIEGNSCPESAVHKLSEVEVSEAISDRCLQAGENETGPSEDRSLLTKWLILSSQSKLVPLLPLLLDARYADTLEELSPTK